MRIRIHTLLVAGPALCAAAMIFSSPAVAADADPAAVSLSSPQRLTLPLSDPSRPARVKVSLLNGSIRVEGGAVREVTIEARSEDDEPEDAGERDARRVGLRRLPNPGSLGLEAIEEDNEVVVSSDALMREVHLKLLVPAGSSLVISTVNGGDLEVVGVEGELELHNTNGEIHASGVRGPITAATVNGDVKIEFGAVVASAAMAFSTLNGDIDLTFPASLKANLELRSDNGEIYSDFDVTLVNSPAKVEDRKEGGRHRITVQRDVTGTVGGGGPEIACKTFNGDVVLRRRS